MSEVLNEEVKDEIINLSDEEEIISNSKKNTTMEENSGSTKVIQLIEPKTKKLTSPLQLTKLSALPGFAAKLKPVPRERNLQSKTASKARSDASQPENVDVVEKKCENSECAAPTLISLVPSRHTPQFVHDPKVVTEPILISGYTTVFQVDGSATKVNDLIEKTADGKLRYESRKPLYRIVPNTHAHIINYVVIDSEGDTLRKIKDNDPVTLKKLLESQKKSAEQLLEKLMGVQHHEKPVVQPTAVKKSTVLRPAPQPASDTLVRNIPVSNTTKTKPKLKVIAPAPAPTLSPHPNLKILSVSSISAVPPTSTVPVPSTSTVPVQAVPQKTYSNAIVTEKSVFDKMQEELRELRETVKLLADNQRSDGASSPKKQKTS